MVKISIVIPLVNKMEYLQTSINSVLDQTYKDIEVLLVLDKKNKEGMDYAHHLNANYAGIKIIELNKDFNVGYARNEGIKEAEGEFLYFLDSDDYIPKDTLKLLVNNIGDNNLIKGSVKNTFLSSSFVVTFKGLFQPKIYGENRFNLIKSNKAKGILFRKQYIENYNISFSESMSEHNDLSFVVPAFLYTSNVLYINEAVYFNRRDREPIFSKADLLNEIRIYLRSYRELKNKYDDSLVQKFLDNQILNFYRKELLLFLNEYKNIDELFSTLHDTFKLIDSDLLKTYDRVLIREIRTIQLGKVNRYKKVYNRHGFLRDLKTGIKSPNHFLQFIYKQFFLRLPMKKNIVLFESFSGKSYSDSPKHIYEHMIKNNKKIKFIWSFNNINQKIPGNVKKVRRLSWQYYYYLARAKYWVSNSRLPLVAEKRKDNIYLQTWHGTPLKRLALDMEEVHMPGTNTEKYKRNFIKDSSKWDYLISPNEYSSNIFKRAFHFEKSMLEFGYPRNDILYTNNNKKDIKIIKKKMNIPLDKKIVLYAPTWRDDDYFKKGQYTFELELDLKRMKEELGKDYIIILRMHYLIANKLDLSAFKGFAFDFSNHEDIAELYLISDVLVTDYSSVFFDYANLKRPILFFTYDLKKYEEQLRGFYLDMKRDLPGPLLMTSDEVIDSLSNINQITDNYENKYEEFYNQFCKWDNGEASKKTVEAVFGNKVKK